MEGRELLIALSLAHNGDWMKIFDVINNHGEVPEISTEEIEIRLKRAKVKAITMLDPEYPENLKRVIRPPLVLYYRGDISLLRQENKCLSVIGTRDPSINASENLDTVVPDNKDLIIVSGLARGTDTLAHELALSRGQKTIAVLPSGINNIYPTSNIDLADRIVKGGGLLITEYPDNCPPEKQNFPFRDRIIAGLGIAVLVSELNSQSGTMITVNYALEFGKDVLVLPKDVSSQFYNNKLIRNGAILVASKQDVLDEIENYIELSEQTAKESAEDFQKNL